MSVAVLGTLLLCFINSSSAGFEVVGGSVVGVVGEDLVLPCSLKPNNSAVDEEVLWLIGSDVVHHYKNQQDKVEHQLPAYWRRTSLFGREELTRGNLSLKLTSVQLKDANTYRCYIAAQTGTDEAPVHVRVNAVGSTPNISAESLGNGNVSLQCESTGWFPQPQLEWRDSRGRILPGDPKGHTGSQSDPEDGFTVSLKATVEENDGNIFFCRVSSQGQVSVQKVIVPRLLYAYPRHRWALTAPILLFLSVCGILAYYLCRGIHLYKRWVISKFTWANTNSHLPGKDIKTYTEPLIICRHKGTGRGQDYKEITLDQLFSPDEDEPDPKVVIVQGHSGYGKSITARKIICDWASGTRYTKEFDLVVLLKCKELIMQGERRSLLELVGCPRRFTPVIKAILKNTPHKALFIIDGFDELKMSAAVPSSHLSSQPFSTAPPADTIQALLGGRILPESFLLVTTRHTAAERLREVLKHRKQQMPEPRFTEILGFSKNMVKNYFDKFPFEIHSTAVQKYDNVSVNHVLLSSCFIPVLCWLTCSVLRPKSSASVRLSELQNVTSIFVLFVSIVLKDAGMNNIETLSVLGKVAKEGIWKKEILFDKISVDLSQILLIQKVSARHQVMYSFVHQTMQEFFAALYFITLEEAEMQSEVKKLLNSVNKPADECLHLLPIIRFLFGLSSKCLRQSLVKKDKLGLPFDEATVNALYEQLNNWIQGDFKKAVSRGHQMLMFQYLYEFHEADSVKAALGDCKSVEVISSPLKIMDCQALIYCLQKESNIKHLDLRGSNLTSEKLELLQTTLANLQCKTLGLDVKNLSDAHVDVLVLALGTRRILRRLRVENSQLSDESVQQILNALRNQESVGSVHLSVKTVSLDMANRLIEHVCSVTVTGIMSVEVSGQKGDSMCSLYVEKDPLLTTVGMEHQGFCLSVTMASSQMPKTTWRGFLTSCRGQCVCVETLLSPDLKSQVKEINVRSSQPPDVLSLINTCPLLQEINWSVDKKERLRNPSLSIRTDMNNMLRLTVGLTPSHSSPAVSLLSLFFPSPSSPTHLDNLRSFLLEFQQGKATTHQADDKTSDVDALDSLFSFLLSVSGLREVELRVGSLTHTWAQHIITLIREQPSLHTVQISAGCHVLHDDLPYWQDSGILKQEGITLMRESLEWDHCTITITGILDWQLQRRRFLPNQAVKITIKENTYNIQSC